MSGQGEHIEIDHIVLVCKGCGGEREFYPDRPLQSAAELVEWVKTKPTRCACGAATCDVKARLKPKVGDIEVAAKFVGGGREPKSG